MSDHDNNSGVSPVVQFSYAQKTKQEAEEAKEGAAFKEEQRLEEERQHEKRRRRHDTPSPQLHPPGMGHMRVRPPVPSNDMPLFSYAERQSRASLSEQFSKQSRFMPKVFSDAAERIKKRSLQESFSRARKDRKQKHVDHARAVPSIPSWKEQDHLIKLQEARKEAVQSLRLFDHTVSLKMQERTVAVKREAERRFRQMNRPAQRKMQQETNALLERKHVDTHRFLQSENSFFGRLAYGIKTQPLQIGRYLRDEAFRRTAFESRYQKSQESIKKTYRKSRLRSHKSVNVWLKNQSYKLRLHAFSERVNKPWAVMRTKQALRHKSPSHSQDIPQHSTPKHRHKRSEHNEAKRIVSLAEESKRQIVQARREQSPSSSSSVPHPSQTHNHSM